MIDGFASKERLRVRVAAVQRKPAPAWPPCLRGRCCRGMGYAGDRAAAWSSVRACSRPICCVQCDYCSVPRKHSLQSDQSFRRRCSDDAASAARRLQVRWVSASSQRNLAATFQNFVNPKGAGGCLVTATRGAVTDAPRPHSPLFVTDLGRRGAVGALLPEYLREPNNVRYPVSLDCDATQASNVWRLTPSRPWYTGPSTNSPLAQ